MTEKPTYEDLETRVQALQEKALRCRQLESQLQESEKCLSDVQRVGKIGSFTLDVTAGVWSGTETLHHMLGIEAKQKYTVADWVDIIHPDHRESLASYQKRVLEKKVPFDKEYCIIRQSDGETRWVHSMGELQFSNSGDVIAMIGTTQDITERKQAEASIRKLSQAIEQSPVSIVITDVTGKIEFVNAKFTQITGYTYSEALGKNPSILKSGETPPEEYRRMWETITAGGVWRGEFHNRKKNNELFWEQASISPVRDEDGVISHFVAVKEDITDRKKLETQLRQTQKMEAVGQLAGGVAHDFNNMLGVIIGHTEMGMNKIGQEDALYKNFKGILAAAMRSAEITRQLLAFARKQTIAPKLLDLNSTVSGMIRLLQRLIGEDIEIEWLPGENLWPVKMDSSQIDQILANLCINARDAISGGGKVTIETHKARFDREYCARHEGFSPGEYVLLSVSDNGSGMDEQTMEKIFEPFFTTKGLGKGTGLGLATVYGITKQNEGFINVYSEPGYGTTFKIYLPRTDDTIDPGREDRPPETDPTGHETILLVEDDSAIRGVVKLMLEQLGYTVLSADTPKKAIQIAADRQDAIDLLITDVIMPQMTGLDLMKALANSMIKCLFMSGYSENVIAHHGVLDEGVNFIQKPFSKRDLGAKVREALES